MRHYLLFPCLKVMYFSSSVARSTSSTQRKSVSSWHLIYIIVFFPLQEASWRPFLLSFLNSVRNFRKELFADFARPSISGIRVVFARGWNAKLPRYPPSRPIAASISYPPLSYFSVFLPYSLFWPLYLPWRKAWDGWAVGSKSPSMRKSGARKNAREKKKREEI